MADISFHVQLMSPPDRSKIKHLHVVRNAHQSGVNSSFPPLSRSPSYGNGCTFNVISCGDGGIGIASAQSQLSS
ncbi:hypothetical protein DY000_02003349 [Brassica cretica]|nr:hypothetical protein DY000_02003349 [Brassica cretica]